METHVGALKRLIVVGMAIALIMAGGLAGSGNRAAAQNERDRERATVTFTELNDSGLSGGAVLTARGQRTEVDMRINGAVGIHPTHIHTGTCDDLDPNPKYPLNNVELNTTELVGMSDTIVDVPLAELLARPHLILIHKSADDLDTYYACGNIVADTTAATAGQEVGGATGETSGQRPLGTMGSGLTAGAVGGIGLAGVIGLAAVASALAAMMLRRRALRS